MGPVAIAALAIVLVLLLVFLLLRRRRGSCVILYGPCNAGKTALFHRLRNGDMVKTISSMKENEGTFGWAGSERTQQHTVDIPGHGRLRWRLKDFIPVAKAVVVLVDSTACGNSAYALDAANAIWDVVHSPLRGARVLVACNKSDDILAVSTKRIKLLLEVQLSALARTRSRYPGYHDQEDEATPVEPAAGPSENFTFEDSSPVPVAFVSMSVKKGDLKQLFQALN